MLVINDDRFLKRAEIIWEKGTNRSEFFRGEVNKYGWVDIGSSFLPSEIIAAYLYAQLENLDIIQTKRKRIWEAYYERLKDISKYDIQLPRIPDFATNNGHMFYMVCSDLKQRTLLIDRLKSKGIYAVLHYQSLHDSSFYKSKHDGRKLIFSAKYTDCLVRLPLYYELTIEDVDYIVKTLKEILQDCE